MSLPDGEFDIWVIRLLTRKQTKATADKQYKSNLPSAEFSSIQLKELYAKRWGIETSFRTLKYTIGLTNFHAKKRVFIEQEVFARLIMYNFREMVTSHVVISQADRKYNYRINFTVAVHICRCYLRSDVNKHPPNVEALIRKNIKPVRPDRLYLRKIRSVSVVSFLVSFTE